jgi:hypothetical protein
MAFYLVGLNLYWVDGLKDWWSISWQMNATYNYSNICFIVIVYVVGHFKQVLYGLIQVDVYNYGLI